MIRWAALVVVVAIAGLGLDAILSDPESVDEQPVDPDSLYDPIVAGEPFTGGIRWIVSRDGIRPVYTPGFVDAAESGLGDDDLVIGLRIDNDARAYPVGLLAAREMVNDWVADQPVLVSWCPLCGTGAVHRREVNGAPTLFGNQGALWGNAMTWWDHRTGSIWSQPLGEAIAGPLKGVRLELLPSSLTEWAAWRSAHPETLVLDGPVLPSGPNDSNVLVVVFGGEAVAGYPLQTVQRVLLINDSVGGMALSIVATPDGLWNVFAREMGSDVVELTLRGDRLTAESGEWDAVTGRNLDGQATDLIRLPAVTAFVDDFHTFWPDGRVREG